jgi:nucleoid-associated protein YgaU
LQDRAAVEVSWDSFFPAAYFPGIQTPFMLSSPDAMIQRLFEWKISAKPVHLILTGTRVNFYAAIQSLQPYRKGGDPGSIYYKIKLKEYREVRIRQVKVSSTGTATVSGGSTRTDNRVQAKTYTVKPGDCLYNISKSTLGDGGRYNEIYSLNKDKLKNPNLIYPGQVLQLP